MLLKKDVCGRTDDEEDDEEEGFEEEEGEEEDGAGDTAEAVVVAVLTLGRISWQKGDVRLLKLSWVVCYVYGVSVFGVKLIRVSIRWLECSEV